MNTWCLSLPGDPAWWQAFTGVVQAILALAIFIVTRKYVHLTGDMVKLQADVVNLQKQSDRRELYDRRVKVYDALMGFLATFVRDMRANIQTIQQLYRDTREADFLFGPEIPTFIEKVAKTANEHRSLDPDGSVRSGNVERLRRIHEIEDWLVTPAFKEAKEEFGRYLKLTEPDGSTEGDNTREAER